MTRVSETCQNNMPLSDFIIVRIINYSQIAGRIQTKLVVLILELNITADIIIYTLISYNYT